MSHTIGKKLLKAFLWTVLGSLILLMLIPVLLYVPFVQDFAVGIATEQMAKSTGMKVEIGKLRLGFPLRLKVENTTVIQANGDTMLTSGLIAVNVKLKPLFTGRIEVGGASLENSFYQLGNSDSIIWLRANISKADITDTDIDLKKGDIALSRADIDGVRVKLRILSDSTVTPPDTTPSKPMIIKAGMINLRDLSYSMEMLPTIDSLGCDVKLMSLSDAMVDMGMKKIYGRSLKVDSVVASYIYPEIAETQNNTVVEKAGAEDSSDSEMWTISADTITLTAQRGLYAQKGALPVSGFSPEYINVAGVAIEVDSFFNQGTSIRVPLKKIKIDDFCGLQILADGTFSMDQNSMAVSWFSIETPGSSLRFDAGIGMGDLMTDPNLPLMLKALGRIDPKEISKVMPDLAGTLKPLTPIALSADIDGTSGRLNVYNLDVRMSPVAHVALEGEIDNPFSPDKIGGELSVEGNLATITDRQFAFLPIKRVPALGISGTVNYQPNLVSGYVDLTTDNGRLAGNGNWNGRSEGYDLTFNINNFPVDAFMPELGIGRVTGSLSVDGKGYNPMNKSSFVDANIKVHEIEYNKAVYKDIALDASLHDGNATGILESSNFNADATVRFDARLDGDTVRWDLNSDVRNLNLMALGLSDSLNRGALDLGSKGYFNLNTQAIDATADISHLTWNLPGLDIVSPKPIALDLNSSDSLLNAALVNGDLNLSLNSSVSLFTFINGLIAGMSEVTQQLDSMRVNADRLHSIFPHFDMLLDMGHDNVASSYLRESAKTEFSHLNAGVHNDSVLSFSTFITEFSTGSTKLDSISLNAIQHGDYLIYHATINNRPGTFDDFAHVTLNGFAGINRLTAYMNQTNIKGEKGFNIGLSAMIEDSVVSVRFVPLKPTIAYKPWTLNKNNYISFNLANKHLDADLELTGEKSFIKLFTEVPAGADSIGHSHGEDAVQEDLVLQISQVHLQDWLSINPFAPPVKGDLNADMRFRYDNGVLTGKGSVGLNDLFYGRERVGTFDLDVDVANTKSGKLMADVSLMVDSVKTVTAQGVLNDSTSGTPFLLDFRMIKFPLRVVNPFIPQGMATVNGMLNGEMKITGDMSKPVFNGFIDFDTTTVKVKMLGTTFSFSEEKIPVDSGIITFGNFAIKGCNANPLYVNGSVNARNLANLGLDLWLKASNIQVVNSQRARRGADVYGKAFLDIDATAKGNMRFLNIDADLRVLPQTNVTYVMTESAETLSAQNTEDMVHFVQFNDTTNMTTADSLTVNSMALALEAALHLDRGATINVDLSSNGSNKINLQPEGDVVFTMSELNGDRMTGRININSGFVRYTPPFMSEKQFEFQEGSYISFNGDVMNPILNIHAVDVMKANVTQDGQNSRLINFDVILSVTNSLDNMNVAFDLATNDDITVQNELASMSAEQRANQAMNLLLYNVYTGAGTKGNANLSGNQLYSFLTSKLNSWAASNIRGVDISFGIDQYDKTYSGSTSTTTSYSYRVSKSFFNDRFKIVVGGNYSTDADADENFSQNLINDISFEYLLNQSGSMYIKIFRHTGYESILEGEITQTGVGFVLKKKLNSLWELFGIRRD